MKCGSKLKRNGKCPNCDVKSVKRKKLIDPTKAEQRKKLKIKIISVSMAVLLLAVTVLGYFMLFYKAKPVINDYIENGDVLNLNNKSGGKSKENEAVLNKNVRAFMGKDAEKVSKSISEFAATNANFSFNVAHGTDFDKLGIGDVFVLDKSESSPFKEVFAGKISSVKRGDKTSSYVIETPKFDEVFDVLNINMDKKFNPDDIESVEALPGVSIPDLKDNEATTTANAYGDSSLTPMTLTDGDGKVQTLKDDESGFDLSLIDIEIDLFKLLNLKDRDVVGCPEYEYFEGEKVNVSVTPTGKKYHRNDCFYVKGKGSTLTLKNAREQNYEPCKICNPPRLKDDPNPYSADAELKLGGQIGIKDIDFDATLDWDILNGKGIEELSVNASGNIYATAELKAKLNAELGRDYTKFTLPGEFINCKVQGLRKKMVPILFVSYGVTGLNVSTLFPGNEYIDTLTMAMPITVGAYVYLDVNGEIALEGTAKFEYEYDFDTTCTAVKDGHLCWDVNNDGKTSKAFSIKDELSGNIDVNLGASVSLYIFNINVVELNIVKLGIEAEGACLLEYEHKKDSGDKEWKDDAKFDYDAYARLYLKLIELNINCKIDLKLFGFVSANPGLECNYCLLDRTLMQWGISKDTTLDEAKMSYTSVTAKDKDSIYYRDTDGKLVKETGAARQVLYEKEFFTICGIDTSYIYVTIPNDEKYRIYRISKDGVSKKTVADDVKIPLTMDKEHFYYISTFDDKSITQMDRSNLHCKKWASFDESVAYMGKQNEVSYKNEFFVTTEDNRAIFAFLGSPRHYYLLNSNGDILQSYGESPAVENYSLEDMGSYYYAAKMSSNGYLRNVAAEVYWLSKNKQLSIITEPQCGWNPNKVGIFTAADNSETNKHKIVLYKAEDGSLADITDVESPYSFFTLCQSDSGDWYFFDQTDTELVLYRMNEDFSNKTRIKSFSKEDKPYSLDECSMVLMDNRIYFYSMTDDKTCIMLDRYNIA